MTTALIDADVFAHQAATIAEKPVDWGDGLWTLHAYEDEALAELHKMIAKVEEATGAKEIVLAVSHPDNFRLDVLPTYKGNRKDKRPPMLKRFLQNYLRDELKAFERPGLEGDDCLGILSTMGKYRNPVICSIDKDMGTIPGVYYNFGKDEWRTISLHEADLFHMKQTLMGDMTDGYTGCPGCGPVTADKILKAALDEGTPWADREQLRVIMWKHVVAAYEKKGLGEEFALSQARVARILRASDYDFKTKKPILWNPPKPQL